jgi:hypothetical protein
MSKEAEALTVPEAPPSAEGIRRKRIGLNVGVQIVLGVAIFVMVNVIGHRYFTQWDFTYSRVASISKTGVKFVKEVKEPVRISLLATRDSPLDKDVSLLLKDYKRYLGDRLELERIDTRRDLTAWENFKVRLYKMKVPFKTEIEGVFVQADRPHVGETGGEKYFYKWIPADAFYVMDHVKHVATAFRGEALLNNAIAGVTNPERPRVAVVTDMGHIDRVVAPAGGGEALTYGHVITEICSTQNIELEPWRMRENPEYATRYKSLFLIAADVFGPQQDEDLTRFFETPGNSLIILLDPRRPCEGLEKWLARYGVQPQDDRVLHVRGTSGGIYKQFIVDAHFMGDSSITKGMENQGTLLTGQSRSLKILNQLEKVRTENIQLTPLLTPSEDFWGEKNFTEDYPRFDAKEDNGKPLYLAVSAERGAASDPRVQMQSSRLVVVGNADLVTPPLAAPNYDFITRSLNWCLHRDEAASSDSSTDKARHKFTINIKPEQWQRILIITTIVMPLAALMTGLLIWSTRRN